jgi:hypothetical protein
VAQQRVCVVDQHGNKPIFRRLRLQLHQATRDGATIIHILTNVPRRVSAERVAALYRRRWTLEMCQLQYCHIGIFCWIRAASPISSNKLSVGDRWGGPQRKRLSVKPPPAVCLSN